jgi:hypothetical protein
MTTGSLYEAFEIRHVSLALEYIFKLICVRTAIQLLSLLFSKENKWLSTMLALTACLLGHILYLHKSMSISTD